MDVNERFYFIFNKTERVKRTMNDVKIMIGVPILTPYLPVEFWLSYDKMIKPENTILNPVLGTLVDTARNNIVEDALEQDCTHILFLDSDMTMDKDMINRLIEHDKDIVSSFHIRRLPPHYPNVFYKFKEEYRHIHQDCAKGLIEVDSVGFGGILIKTEIFKKLKYPYFKFLFKDNKKLFGEDLLFCKNAKEAGYKIFVDCDLECGHLFLKEYKKQDWIEYERKERNGE